jgi:hypothetical protein
MWTLNDNDLIAPTLAGLQNEIVDYYSTHDEHLAVHALYYENDYGVRMAVSDPAAFEQECLELIEEASIEASNWAQHVQSMKL